MKKLTLSVQADGTIILLYPLDHIGHACYGADGEVDRLIWRPYQRTDKSPKGANLFGLPYEEAILYDWIEIDDEDHFVNGEKLRPRAHPLEPAPAFLRYPDTRKFLVGKTAVNPHG